jgi:hypothetical protein
MKKILLLLTIVLCGCSASDVACKKPCSFAKTAPDGSYFLVKVNGVPVDCETNTPSAETIEKIKAEQNATSFCCCD